MENTKHMTHKMPTKEERHKLFGSVKPGPKQKPTDKNKMPDLQNVQKDFLFDIDAVGISNVKHPIIVQSNLNPTTQTTIATFKLTSKIEKTSKGTNMSRFTEQLNQYHEKGFIANFDSLKQFTKDLAERLDQNDATIELRFPWFFERRGPQSDLVGMNHADISMLVTYDAVKGCSIHASLTASITTLCPCSKEISEYSAHNQRGHITMEVSFTDDFDETKTDWKEMLLEAAESNASARLHPVLKRPDEKMVTEQAYENPRFVEDMVRLVAADLYESPFITKFEVSCRNEESIHMHDAVASLRYNKLDSSSL
ncbi:GTP cyclohydrolase I FolE2 [Ornithinibacillus sp. L9]|uniref:GTP cyclohydrolase FolE2 n=1 Tax=Ornithinibacillus caprae TaxID=2678566 RepID=A0A6N8FP39_9BACI|nr:GTP cyclohydrolase FolE2 [Ornithinibacillus caprae]MUK90666.1 GTP cyclohydrolase I FolE2 [Ornithinibacillus caprae]